MKELSDEDAIGMAIIALEDMYDPDEPNNTYAGYTMPFNKAALRLRVLKERCTWKPSDEQMEAMQKALVDLCGKDEHNIITGLYYDLKKLRKE